MENPFTIKAYESKELFCDREEELQLMLQNCVNSTDMTLISQRRIGKTGLVLRLFDELKDVKPDIHTIYLDIFASRNIDDFIKLMAEAAMRSFQPKTSMGEKLLTFIKSLRPQLSFDNITGEPQLQITYQTAHEKEYTLRGLFEFLDSQNEHIVIAIDEFQQIGEMSDTLIIQKKLRSVWQHHKHTSYCLFGSKQHMMKNLFQSRKMPFYQFGDMFFIKRIPTEKWVPFIVSRFADSGKTISAEYAQKICETVDNYSSYVQQLAWNIFALSDDVITEQDIKDGLDATMAQSVSLFVEQTANLTSYQLNLIRAICQGYHDDFGSKEVTSRFELGTKSNLIKLKNALVEREIIEITEDGCFIADPLFERWFVTEMK